MSQPLPRVEFAVTDRRVDLEQVSALGQSLRRDRLGPDELRDGFVSIAWDVDSLLAAAAHTPHAVARAEGRVVGYAIAADEHASRALDVLRPYWDAVQDRVFRGRTIGEQGSLIMGQIAVAAAYRGRGTFAGLYEMLRATYAERYPVVVTVISLDNARSLAAHHKLGFVEIGRERSIGGNVWAYVAWAWCD